MATEVVAVKAAIRDQFGDHLLTPKNSALVVIDYQPSQIAVVRSMDHDLLLKNVVSTAKVAKLFGVPIVHSTINVMSFRHCYESPSRSASSKPTPEGVGGPYSRTSCVLWARWPSGCHVGRRTSQTQRLLPCTYTDA